MHVLTMPLPIMKIGVSNTFYSIQLNGHHKVSKLFSHILEPRCIVIMIWLSDNDLLMAQGLVS